MFDVIFLHGFGGFDNNPTFIKNGNKIISQNNWKCRLQSFPWNSIDFKFDEAGAKFDAAIQEAEDAGKQLKDHIMSLESKENTYYIIGHSLGCRVIHSMLKNIVVPFKKCCGIVYLGAAINRNEKVPEAPFSSGIKLINYFSPEYDLVLNKLYYNKTAHSAAGATGLEAGDCVLNFGCSATHTRKLGVVHSDWSNMAWPLIELMAINEGEQIIGDLNPNIDWSVGKGTDWWNNIIELSNWEINGETCSVFLQQHKFNYDHYRISVGNNGSEKRERLAWANKLWPLLQRIDLKPGSESWIFKSIC